VTGEGYAGEGVEKALGTPLTVPVIRPLQANPDIAEQFWYRTDFRQLFQAGHLPAIDKDWKPRASKQRHRRFVDGIGHT